MPVFLTPKETWALPVSPFVGFTSEKVCKMTKLTDKQIKAAKSAIFLIATIADVVRIARLATAVSISPEQPNKRERCKTPS